MTTQPYRHSIPADILALSHERDMLRRRGQYDRADALKRQLEDAGYLVKDNPHGAHLVILPSITIDGKQYRTARQLPSFLNEVDRCTFSINILAQNTHDQTRRCIESVLRFADNADIEIILVDNSSKDGIDLWAEMTRYQEPRLHVIRTSRIVGAAEARNIGLKQSRGHYILLLDSSTELSGDIFTPLATLLEDSAIGIIGTHGLHTDDLRHFEESTSEQNGEVVAVDGPCIAFQRKFLRDVGLFDEGYRTPAYMDIDFTFAIRDSGTDAHVVYNLPLICHPTSRESNSSESEQARQNKRNFYRFLEKWGDREDLLPAPNDDDGGDGDGDGDEQEQEHADA